MENQPNKNEEIDLITIFNGISKFIFSGIQFCKDLLQILLTKWILFSFIILLGCGVGYSIYSISPPVYISSVSISSKILTNDYCASIIGKLSETVADGTPELIAKKLNIPIEAAEAIKKIEFSNYSSKLSKIYEDRDTIVLGIPFKIFVHAYNNTVFDTLELAIVNYLENNKYALDRKKINKENILLMREKLKSEMQQLDTLKKNISSNILPRGTGSGFVFGQPIDPINIYKASMEFYRTDLNLREDLELIDSIQVIESFSPRNKPDSPKLLKMLVFFSSLFFMTTLFIVFRIKK